MNGQIEIKDAERESSFATEDKLAMAGEPEPIYSKSKAQ